MRADRTLFWLAGILAVALTFRVLAAVLVQHHVSQTPGRLCLIAGDAEGYWELARKLAHGEDFEIYQPPRKVLRMPGFPAILALSIALFGEHVGAARIVLAIIGTLACGGVYWLGVELFGRTVGLLAAALAAVSPTFIVTSVMLLSETAFALGMLLCLIPLARLVRAIPVSTSSGRILGWGLLTGLGGALACYIRPSWLLFPPLAGAWLILMSLAKHELNLFSANRIKAAAGAAGIILGLFVGLLPWTCRNYVVTGGHIVPTTLWMGPSLYDGLHPKANGDSDMTFLKEDALYQRMSEYDVDRHYRREAWSWAARNPVRVLELAWIKQVRYWNLWPNTPQFSHWAVRLVLLAYLLPVLACTIWGLMLGRSGLPAGSISWGWVVILTLGPILYFSGLHTIFVSSIRYRMPAEFPLLVMTAAGVQDLVQRFGRKKGTPGT